MLSSTVDSNFSLYDKVVSMLTVKRFSLSCGITKVMKALVSSTGLTLRCCKKMITKSSEGVRLC